MIKIIADNKIPFLKGVLEPVARVHYVPGREISNQHLADADALIVRTRTKCNETLLKGTPVKYIATATIGYDHIDTTYCDRAGIRWSNAPGCNAGSVKQYVASALSLIARHEKRQFRNMCIGIIGVGHVGKKIESLARALNMPVFLNDPPRERAEGKQGFASVDELLSAADVVSLHVPLQTGGPDKTHHMANETFFSRIKKGAWLINTARGEVMQTQALIRSIRQGTLKGAAIDVWEEEPFISNDLLHLAHIATPHIAGYSSDGKANGTARSVRALSRFFNLGLDNWYPDNIPGPSSPVIVPGRDHENPDMVLQQIMLHTYDIMQDSNRLKSSPAQFEQFRDDYPVRREAQAYTVKTKHLSPSTINTIQKLGFNTS